MPDPGHRSLSVLRGAADHTAARARALLARLPPEQVLWVSPDPAPAPFEATPPQRVRAQLGRTLAAVVLDWHAEVDANVLGQCEGLLSGGGRLLLRLSSRGLAALPGSRRFVTFPHARDDVTARFAARLAGLLDAVPLHDAAVEPGSFEPCGNAEQDAVVRRLRDAFASRAPARLVLLAGRGRGKSSALGLALRDLAPPRQVVITGPTAAAVGEVFRFATGSVTAARAGSPRFVESAAVFADGAPAVDVVVVDEAAQLPVPVLQAWVERHARAHLVFATTTAGYEGTGRGFSLRFVEWLARRGGVTELRLEAPVRFAPGCPVERFAYDTLLLDAAPAPLAGRDLAAAPHFEVLDRDALARNDALLGQVFGLLVHAHYRTTPRDLHALLDAPNLRLHVLRAGEGGPVLAVNLLAREGGLDAATVETLRRGRARVQGHALAESLVAHLGHAEAGPLRMWRSVRLATHPKARRRGLARLLVEHGHRTLDADLFGTLFGLTPELLRFRRGLGYRLARLGASRGARTGEPSALMLRPVSGAARALVERVQGELARDLPTQLALFESEGDLRLPSSFRAALFEGLPRPATHDDASLRADVHGYTHGPRIYESVAVAVERLVEARAGALALLDARERALIQARVRESRPWRECAVRAGLPSVPATMRAMRRAVRRLADA